jgi:hypothetical protein
MGSIIKNIKEMKKFYILLVVLFLVTGAIGQDCLPEGITFTTQAQIDNFQTNYPNCSQILGGVSIYGGNNITNLNGLSVLTSIGDYLSIVDNDALTSLTALNNLTSIGDYLSIVDNDALTSLTALNNLTSIGDYLSIFDNDALTSLTALNNLTSIGGSLDIGSNNALTSLTGLNNVTSIGDYLSIYNNNALTSLTGLNNVTSIGDDLYIYYNNALTSLTGLNNVTSIAGRLYIYNNDALTSLMGLNDIDAGSITVLNIINNGSLSICEVQSICDYLANPNGTVYIQNNSIGCNSVEEVEAACGLGINENGTSESYISIYPNPTSTTITIENYTKGTVSILNLNGQQLLQQEITELKTQLDISTLPSGVYFVRVTGERTVQVGKFIKQ